MALDRELYQKYDRALREWSAEESIQRILDARKLTPEQAWNRYITLWEQLMHFSIGDRDARHLEHLQVLDHYYSIAQKLHDYQMKNGE